jgi:hypothetical protein
LSSDESNHAEQDTWHYRDINAGCDEDVPDAFRRLCGDVIAVTAKGIEACPGQGVTVPRDESDHAECKTNCNRGLSESDVSMGVFFELGLLSATGFRLPDFCVFFRRFRIAENFAESGHLA